MNIRSMKADDWEAVREIYVQGVATGQATFETEAPEWKDWNRAHLESCRLVAESENDVIGWGALSAVSGRCVYGGVGEVSVYVAEEKRGEGVGTALLQRLVVDSEEAGFWTLEAGIFPENKASIAVHEKCGFRWVGVRQRLGQMKGIWRDVVLMERRSEKVG